MNSTNTSDAPLTGSMPISMAVQPKPTTETSDAASTPKDLEYFRREFEKATLAFYRSTRKVADLLLDARITLSPEDFKQLTEHELQFDYSTVCKLIKSASNFRLNDPKNQSLLPEAWTLRYEIMIMDEATFRVGVTKGIIHPNCTLADLKKLREQLETPKRKKASAKAKPKGKDSTAATTAEAPKPTPASAKDEESEPHVEEASVKAPVSNSALFLPPNSTAESAAAVAAAPAMAPATAAVPAKGRIAIVVTQEMSVQHKADLDGLMARIEALVKDYDFIGSVALEVAA